MKAGSRLFDVSHWNSTVDFGIAKANGWAGAYLKGSENTTADPTFRDRKAAAKQHKIPVGAYLFFHPGQPVKPQVDAFIQTVGDVDLRVALDFEVTDGVPADQCAARAKMALGLLAQHYGYAPLLYTYPAFMPNCAGLQGFPLWIADYSGAPAPRIGAWGDWTMWQTGQEAVPGVTGGDGPGTDVNVAPSLARLIVPPKTPPITEVSELTPQDWKDMGALIDKCITHVRNGENYNLGVMAKELADIKADIAAIKAKG